MKNNFTTFFLLIAVAASAAGQQPWTIQHPAPHANTIEDIHAFDSIHALAVGNFPSIMETNDGGKSWQFIDVPYPEENLSFTRNDIYFLDSLSGWIAGSQFTMLNTNDGGKTWKSRQLLASDKWADQLTKVFFTDRMSGWAIGYRVTTSLINHSTSGGILLRTIDGGESWNEKKPLDSIPPLFDVAFLDSLHGWAAGNVGFLMKTNDGGSSWERVPVPDVEDQLSTTNRIFSIAPLSESRIILSTIMGQIHITLNNGTTWTQTGSNIGRKIQFSDSLRGIAYGSGAEYYHITVDGGQTWQKISFPSGLISTTAGSLHSLSSAPDGSIWMAGSAGLVLRSIDKGSGWQRLTSGTEDVSDIHFVDNMHGWAVGAANTLLQTTDGGKSWNLLGTVDKTKSLQEIFFYDNMNGWLIESVKNQRTLFKTNNGGSSWEKIVGDSIAMVVGGLHFFDTQNGLGIQFKNKPFSIIKTMDGGSTWKSVYSFDEGIFGSAMSFTSRFNGWMAGSKGTLLHTTDGGMTWNMSNAGTQLNLFSIHFRDSLNGWAGGEKSTLFSTSDGGATWQNRTDTTYLKNSNILSIRFTDALHGALANGWLWETNDGGATWQESKTTPIQNNSSVKHVFSLPNGAMWAIGERGIILYRAGQGTSIAEDFEKENISAIRVYPNPASGTIQISITDSKKGILTLTDALGKVVCTIAVEHSGDGFTAKFDTDNVHSGSYFLQWKNGDKQETIPLVIAR
jgi:photosystem II stability/assembly factor-like uncharacterized protein